MKIEVAPLAGARIEIGLPEEVKRMALVAPLAGARIEILKYCIILKNSSVAPLAGARIEILLGPGEKLLFRRRSPRGSAD